VTPAHADGLLPIPGPEHDHNSAINNNSTDQSARSDATTKQANFNVPISVLSFDSNNGDVKQSNKAGTEANAENGNATYQNAAGRQDGVWDGGKDGRQDQAGSNANRTDQHASADAYTKQVNVNAPISVLSFGSNNGNVDQSNRAYTDANAENYNSTKQAESGSQGGQWNGKDSRNDNATNDNRTDQQARADASTKQVNVNAPISVLSFGSNNGNVDQSNKAYTDANAENYNSTKQQTGEQHSSPKHDYGKQCECDGQGPKGHDQAESGSNRNDTHQRASADASTKQKNVNAPVSILSFGSNNGYVDQSNQAYTNANAENYNSTFQKADGQSHDKQPAQYGRDGIDGSKDGGKQFQSPSNDNHTDQHAYAKATTKQKNVNFPVSFLSFGSNNGNVQQHNSAGTQAFAGNANWTGQAVGPVMGAV
jgi:hypothetical protein